MKKTLVLLTLIFACQTISIAQIKTPANSPLASVSQAIGLTNITITYCRPSVKGRKIFGNLVPYDKVWRTGANKVTTFKFDDDVEINGREIKAGSYGFLTIPNKKTWKVIFNSDDKQWGAFQYDNKKDILSFDVAASELPTKIENLTFAFKILTPTSAEIILLWEKSQIRLLVEQCVDEKIMTEIMQKASDPNAKISTLAEAAEYYNDKNINLDKAYVWAEKATVAEPYYWHYTLLANIADKIGKKDVALINAKKGLELALKEKDDSYILMNKNLINKLNIR